MKKLVDPPAAAAAVRGSFAPQRHLWIAIAFAGCSSPSTTPRPSAGGSPFESFATTAPRVGDRAPDFQLADSDGKPVRLAEAIARGPVVLVWGSFS